MRKQMSNIYSYNGHLYKIAQVPIIDGVPYRGNYGVKQAIMDLISPIYKVDGFTRKLPPVLLNWQQVERKALVRLLQRILSQLSEGFQVTDAHVLTNYGFALYVPQQSPNDCIYVKVVLEGVDYHKERFVPVNQVQSIIDAFFSPNTNIINKSVVIS